ncbi:MAG: 16S rRNA (guanine(966)-N(2))-methyltransferase RsmD [Oscillospiraceae bacterium]
MKIITGDKKGKSITTLQGEQVRPTASRVKEGIFSAIQFIVPYCSFLDLFCGSGQMGIEALSRNAREVYFVDNYKQSIAVTKENLKNADFTSNAFVISADYKTFLQSTDKTFDIAFLDPPYNEGILQQALPLVVSKINDGGIILCEHDSKDILPEKVEDFILKKKYKYGRICVSKYEKDTD